MSDPSAEALTRIAVALEDIADALWRGKDRGDNSVADSLFFIMCHLESSEGESVGELTRELVEEERRWHGLPKR